MNDNSIVDHRTGEALGANELISRLAVFPIVFLGELHDHSILHQNQLEIVQGLHRFHPNLVVGLELFERSRQDLLDRWITGGIDPKDFERQTLESVLNRSTWNAYRPLLEWARENDIKLLALNAPRSITSQVARSGIESLEPRQRDMIARDLVIGPEDYKKRVTRVLVHHGGRMDPDRFFSAQVIWDETMAETVADYLSSPEGHGRWMLVIAGNEHVYRGYGLPSRVARRIEIQQGRVLMPLTSDNDMLASDAADFTWSVSQIPRRRRGLGLSLKKDAKGRLTVAAVEADSRGERMGIHSGDRLVRMNGRPIRSAMDIHHAAVRSGTENFHELTVERDGRELNLSFRFTPPGQER